MTLAITTKPIPLQQDQTGTIYVRGTRIPLDTIVYAYRNGESAEEIVESFSSLKLADVYAIIAYYLEHQIDVETYLQARQDEAQSLRNKIESHFPSHNL
ncbi:hypothetical protein MNBD_CHLOROFLEXI01-1031 [hydrothermal vent metagenome]|uniref:DUF433 domain-containing protein n=1 Tax=hydrothermal vent metagenome TaxID=652676 RepID=A0A3B0UN85_9ZZZZ